MRLIGTLETEKKAFAFYAFLLREGIQNIYESYNDEKTDTRAYRIWIYDEDDFPLANDWLTHFKQNPEDPQFQEAELAISATPSPPHYTEIAKQEDQKWKSVPDVRVKVRGFHITFTHLILFFCAALYLWNSTQKEQMEKSKGVLAGYLSHTYLEKQLLFDYPVHMKEVDIAVDNYSAKEVKELDQIPPSLKNAMERADEIPTWRGLYSFFFSDKKEGGQKASQPPLFEKIRQGEVWRLFTPCLLHFDFLHILFNMAWLWILGKQIEERIHWKKMALMILLIGIVSNTAQYLMSGPSFLGFSGVIVGMAGFIWMRQRQAPWEGYPLSRPVLLFLLLFVLAMVVLGFLAFTLKAFSVLEIAPLIANTAHVAGGICGVLLGRGALFSRGKNL